MNALTVYKDKLKVIDKLLTLNSENYSTIVLSTTTMDITKKEYQNILKKDCTEREAKHIIKLANTINRTFEEVESKFDELYTIISTGIIIIDNKIININIEKELNSTSEQDKNSIELQIVDLTNKSFDLNKKLEEVYKFYITTDNLPTEKKIIAYNELNTLIIEAVNYLKENEVI